MGALSRAVALRFAPNTTLKAGSELVLGIDPRASATTRTVTGDGLTEAQALARGMGAGASRYYTDAGLEPPGGFADGLSDSGSFYNSVDLSILSGGGQITGEAVAKTLAAGSGDLLSVANATNIGLANLDFMSRFGGLLSIGLEDDPFAARSTAAADTTTSSKNNLGFPAVAELQSIAIVRGLEGRLEDEPGSDSTPENDFARTFFGQPKANVEAEAELDQCSDSIDVVATAEANAVGLERVLVKNVPLGDRDGTATIGGEAVAKVKTEMGLDPDLAEIQRLEVSASAIGIEHSRLFGAPTLNTNIEGSGLAVLSFMNGDCFDIDASEADANLLEGIGIRCTEIFTNRGNDSVTAAGGAVSGGATLRNGMDAAGFTGSDVYTGMGNDFVMGIVYTEYEAGIDANGDGVFSKNIFLDESAINPTFPGGYDGIRDTVVDTGMDNDQIRGSSHGSWLFGSMGSDSIVLDRAWDSQLWGGLDGDSLAINGPILGVIEQWGGLGDDSLKGADGANGETIRQILDGGLGQDIIDGGSGRDEFLFTNAAAALEATSSTQVNSLLTDADYWSSLSASAKEKIWDQGLVTGASNGAVLGNADAVRNFQAGEGGDVMCINSALAGITEELWHDEGALFEVTSSGKLQVIDGEGDECSAKIGIVIGQLKDIQSLGLCSPQIAYATDTRQLMYDADGDWSNGSVTFGTVTTIGELSKSNFCFSDKSVGDISPTAGVC
jgi:hypothetical protein